MSSFGTPSGKALYFVINCEIYGTINLLFFHHNHKVHSAYKTLKHLWFAFVSCLKQGPYSSLAFVQLCLIFCR